MFGYSKLFRSKWRAMFWSAGIIWLALEVSSPDAPAPDPAADLSNLQDLINLQQAAE